jgi:hypothetical protein
MPFLCPPKFALQKKIGLSILRSIRDMPPSPGAYYPINIGFIDCSVIYNLVTFNYDTLLEKFCCCINNRTINESKKISFSYNGEGIKNVKCFKLHGSMEKNNIIPPTWAKLFSKDLSNEWQGAHYALKNANEIRIVGFSFPETDSHISYLFKSAIMENENLKYIDVLCLDDNASSIKEKYRKKFTTNKLRFRNENISEYFNNIIAYAKDTTEDLSASLEKAHDVFFSKPEKK